MATVKRCVMLGLDGLCHPLVEKFVSEGEMPNIEKLIRGGVHTRIRPVIPPQTPTNWNTLATGASPGTHGVVQWGSHIPGEPVHEFHRHEAYHAALCRAEYIWEAASRVGVDSILFNYLGFPPTTKSATSIDFLFSGRQSNFDLAPATVYHNLPEHNCTDLLEPAPADTWKNIPNSGPPPLEVELSVETSVPGNGFTLYALIFGENRYDTVLIGSKKDAAAAEARLRQGEWSPWLSGVFDTKDQGSKEGLFRFKLQELSDNASRISLYRTDAFASDGSFCSDTSLGRRLVEELGPYSFAASSADLHGTVLPEWAESHDVWESLGLEWGTFDEVLAAEARWWSRAARTAMDSKKAKLLILQWHLLDCVGHVFFGKIDPTGSYYEPEKADFYWKIVRDYYRAADRFVGEFLGQLDDGGTVFAVVSDHGMVADVKAVSLINLFKERGWVTLTPDGTDVDWAGSRVFFVQNHLWINLKGRDEGGIVSGEDYGALRQEILNALRSLTDPENGDHCFAIVVPREDAAMIGLWGDYIGDVCYCYSGGYRWTGPEVLSSGETRIVFPCGGGNHGPMVPTYETDVTSVMGDLVLWGPGVKKNFVIPKELQKKYCSTDLAPTLSRLIGIPTPAQNEGRVLHEFLEGMESGWPERESKPLGRHRTDISPRPTVRTRPKSLQGDDTDEI